MSRREIFINLAILLFAQPQSLCHNIYIIPLGPINDFIGTEVVVDFPPETKSKVEKQTTNEVPRKSYRPKCGINFYHTSYKILVESVTL